MFVIKLFIRSCFHSDNCCGVLLLYIVFFNTSVAVLIVIFHAETDVKLNCFLCSCSPTLYIGESKNGFYALPAYADESTVSIEVSESINDTCW